MNILPSGGGAKSASATGQRRKSPKRCGRKWTAGENKCSRKRGVRTRICDAGQIHHQRTVDVGGPRSVVVRSGRPARRGGADLLPQTRQVQRVLARNCRRP